MLRGVFQSASALLAFQSRHEALATNLANLQTTGFKAYRPALGSFARLLLQRRTGSGAEAVVGPLGTDVAVVGGKTDTSQGALRETGQELDLAFSGEGFFTIGTPDGPRYTRAGHFHRDAEGRLVTPEGWFVLDDRGDPLELGNGPVRVEEDGSVWSGSRRVGRLGIVHFTEAAFLEREATGLFNAVPAAGEMVAAPGQVLQGFLEGANVDPAQAMVDLLATFRAYEANQRALEAQDETLRRAVNDLARV